MLYKTGNESYKEMKNNRICRKSDEVDGNREKRPIVSVMI